MGFFIYANTTLKVPELSTVSLYLVPFGLLIIYDVLC